MTELPIKSKHLIFEQETPTDDNIYLIINKKQNIEIGVISHLKFLPDRLTIWNERDLKDILKAIEYLKKMGKQL